jgi:fatty-acid desaturase
VPGAVNAQAAVEAIQSDPAARKAAAEAVEREWFALHKAAEDSIATARTYAVAYAENTAVRTVLGRLTFLEMLSLLLVVSTLAGGMSVLLWGGIGDQLKGAIVTLMLIGGFTGVTQFWFGSSLGSKKKDDEAKVL